MELKDYAIAILKLIAPLEARGALTLNDDIGGK